MAMSKKTKTIVSVGVILILAGVGAYFLFRKPKPIITPPEPEPEPTPEILQEAFDNLNFDVGKSTIRESSFPSLDKLAETLAKSKNWKLEIAGHTDNSGSDAYNMKLSTDRANAVKDYLVKKGVSAETITAQGFGESKPLVANDSSVNKQRNRRVEFKIVKPSGEIVNVKA